MSSYLTLADEVTIERDDSPEMGEHSGRPMGRGKTVSFTLKAQIETSRKRRAKGDSDAVSEAVRRELVLDRRLCKRKGYTPQHGDHVVSLKNHETKEVDTLDEWISDVKNDGAGALWRCDLTDRNPQR